MMGKESLLSIYTIPRNSGESRGKREQNEGKGAGKDTEMTGEQEGIAEGAFERN